MKITKSALDSVLNEEGGIRYVGKTKSGIVCRCYGVKGKPSAKASVIYQKQICRKGIWVNI
jgi:hypothetical protein|tara:strand:- start:292 stop:474 length:183 start_codon:yes stop_codon:yes gene_type:complete